VSKKTAVITGASSGIGFALARAYLDAGFNVVGNARSLERLLSAKAQLGSPSNFVPVAGDVAAPETARLLFRTALEHFDRVHVLINNAGIFTPKAFVDYTPEELGALVDTNLKGFVYPSQEAARHMVPRRDGHIITITASIASQPLSNVPAVLPILIKGGLNHATRALALELAPHNVRVSAIAPGIIDTPLYTKDMHEFLNTLQPMGHLGNASEVAKAALYLSSSEFTTGAVIPVDGGMSAGRF
jgi:NAD(P)-dependent dehydrogenase (short-subunit alcohol dehydrogenase family)